MTRKTSYSATALTRPQKLGQPFTHWSIRKLATYLHENVSHPIILGREALRQLLHRHSVTFQRTVTWKDSNDPDLEAKLEVIADVLEHYAERAYAFDEFGPLGIRPTAEKRKDSIWTPRQAAGQTTHRTAGVTCFHGCYCIGEDTLWVSTTVTRAEPKASPRSKASEPMPRTASLST